MTAIALGLFGLMLVAAALVRRRSSLPASAGAEPAPPPARRWGIVVRRGPPADFRCGHRTRRNAAFSSGGGTESVLIRKIPRWMAHSVPCPDCVLELLAEKSLEEAIGFERLVPVKDVIDSAQKNRPE